jgi:hypothetical protein
MSYGKISEGPSGFIKPFSSNKYLEGTQDFLNSNSIVAKFAFLLLVIVAFVVLIRFGVSFISWLFTPVSNPILIDGMIDARQMVHISQNPSLKGSIPIMRSVNKNDGLEFTWSVWIHVDDFSYKQDEYKHVFHKGNDDINITTPPIGMNFPNNAPGLYITPKVNNLLIVMNTFEKINEEIIVNDLPLNKWVNVIIRVSNQYQLDVYINGTLTKRHILKGVPKQNYGDVYASMNGGFSGYTSNLRYFNTDLGTNQIQKIVDNGPNMKIKSNNLLKGKPRYLSSRWFFGNNAEI